MAQVGSRGAYKSSGQVVDNRLDALGTRGTPQAHLERSRVYNCSVEGGAAMIKKSKEGGWCSGQAGGLAELPVKSRGGAASRPLWYVAPTG